MTPDDSANMEAILRPGSSAAEGQILLFLGLLGLGLLAMAVWTAVQKLLQWHRNNRSPRLTLSAAVTDKRTREYRSRYLDSVTCYVTFATEDGLEREMEVDPLLYETLRTGEQGMLTLQGTRFLGFERM
ncbi:MAG: DUF2500 domain-containing protein [Clostridia bacterium]|nr:DUF2500 domain-containing protein [Clostridia bacterium]